VPDILLRALSGASLALLAPILFVQARYVRRVTPRLPPADSPPHGVTSDNPQPLRLVVLGESTAVGVGVSTHADALAGHTARALATATGRAVAWRVVGRSGASARQLAREFLGPDAILNADVVVVALGVNDTISVSSVGQWRRGLDAVLDGIRRLSPDALVLLSGVPPMQYLPVFPVPLRHVLGLRAYVLERTAMRWAASRPHVVHVPHPRVALADAASMFCADRFHPSAAGYAHWAAALTGAASGILETSSAVRPNP
jgi:lysophospholipase L1-like esterase